MAFVNLANIEAVRNVPMNTKFLLVKMLLAVYCNFGIIVDAHPCNEEKNLSGIVALESEPGEKGSSCLASLCHAKAEKEREV